MKKGSPHHIKGALYTATGALYAVRGAPHAMKGAPDVIRGSLKPPETAINRQKTPLQPANAAPGRADTKPGARSVSTL
jgi:hypothetical protein